MDRDRLDQWDLKLMRQDLHVPDLPLSGLMSPDQVKVLTPLLSKEIIWTPWLLLKLWEAGHLRLWVHLPEQLHHPLEPSVLSDLQ